jgi:hypothetical protein
MEISNGGCFIGKGGETVIIGKIETGAAELAVKHPGGSEELLLVALDEWPWIKERFGLIPATPAG